MSTPDLSAFHIRKWYLQIEDTLAGETGAPADGEPLRKIVIAACLRNPFAGRYVEDLSSWIAPSPELGSSAAASARPRAGRPSRAMARPAWWGSTANTSMATRC